jgi:hypothetical protein
VSHSPSPYAPGLTRVTGGSEVRVLRGRRSVCRGAQRRSTWRSRAGDESLRAGGRVVVRGNGVARGPRRCKQLSDAGQRREGGRHRGLVQRVAATLPVALHGTAMQRAPTMVICADWRRRLHRKRSTVSRAGKGSKSTFRPSRPSPLCGAGSLDEGGANRWSS